MIVRRIVGGIIAVAAMAAAAGVAVVSVAFAVFTLLRDYVGPSGAAAIIAAAIAVVLAIAALMILGQSKAKPAVATPPFEGQGMSQRLFFMLRERPVVAAGAAIAAGLLAWKNPRLVGVVMRMVDPGRDRS